MDNIDTILSDYRTSIGQPVSRVWHIKGLRQKFAAILLQTQAVCRMEIAKVHNQPVFADFFFKEISTAFNHNHLDLYVRTVTLQPKFNYAIEITVHNNDMNKPLTLPLQRNVIYVKGSCEETCVTEELFVFSGRCQVVNGPLMLSERWRCGEGAHYDEYRLQITATPIYPNKDLEALNKKADDTDAKSESQTVPSVGTSITGDFGSLLSGGDNYADLKLETKDNMTLSTHKFVLSARSLYFRTLIEEEMKKENFDGTIKLGEVNAEPMMAILHWMYAGDLPPTFGRVMEEVVNAAVAFELTGLLKILDEKLIKVCNADNMFDLYKVAKTNEMATAIADIAEFIKQNV